MIPGYELRLGNYVLTNEKLQQISMVKQRSSMVAMKAVDEKEASTEYTLESISPVILTDEILKQCGFVYHDYFKFWQLIESTEGNRSEMDIDNDYNIIDFMRKPVVKKVSSLHHLQNIYFILTGKELNFVGEKETMLSMAKE